MLRPWTPDEIEFLLTNWLIRSANQIAKILGRSRSAVCGMIGRLRQRGIAVPRSRAGGAGKKFNVNPRVGQMRPKRDNVSKNKGLAAIPPTPKFHRVSQPLTTDPCSLIELEPWQCHWPLGDLLDPPRLFCGAPSLDGFPYCAHHHFRAVQSSPREKAA